MLAGDSLESIGHDDSVGAKPTAATLAVALIGSVAFLLRSRRTSSGRALGQ